MTIEPEDIAVIDAIISEIRNECDKPIKTLKLALSDGETPEHLWCRYVERVHEDIHTLIQQRVQIDDDSRINTCEMLARVVAHLMVRIAKMELDNERNKGSHSRA